MDAFIGFILVSFLIGVGYLIGWLIGWNIGVKETEQRWSDAVKRKEDREKY